MGGPVFMTSNYVLMAERISSLEKEIERLKNEYKAISAHSEWLLETAELFVQVVKHLEAASSKKRPAPPSSPSPTPPAAEGMAATTQSGPAPKPAQ